MKKIVVFLGVLCVFGCSKNEKADVSQEKMVDVLTDLTVASSARSISNKRDSVQYIVSYENILKKHGLDSLQFVKAQRVYQEDPDVYTAIYDSVYNRLQKKLEEIRATPADKDENQIIPISRLRDVSIGKFKKE